VLTDFQLRPAITLLEPTGVHVKELRIQYGYLSKFHVASLLHSFPNLKKLSLQDIYPTEDSNQERRELGTISLPKLTYIKIHDCYKELEDLVKDFRDCSITDFNIRFQGMIGTGRLLRINQNVVAFIKKQEKSLIRLHFGLPANNLVDWSLLGDLKEMRLKKFELTNYRVVSTVLLDFLRQNGSTLKSLTLYYCVLTDEMLDGICESVKNLDTLRLASNFNDVSNGLLALQKLKNLRKLIVADTKRNVLEIFTVSVNQNKLEIETPLQDAPTEFIAQLRACLPSLRHIFSVSLSDSNVTNIVINFKNLEDVNYPPARMSRELLECIKKNGGNKARFTMIGCSELREEFVREISKDRQELALEI
jgi:hypothetical protein